MFILCSAFLMAAWIRVTRRGVDAWPFSHYPMFSRYFEPAKVEVFRVALETQAGDSIWWRSRFYRTTERAGSELRRLHYAAARRSSPPDVVAAEQKRCLLEVLRLIRLEEGDADRYRAFRIVRRTVEERAPGGWVIQDQIVASIPIESLNGVRGVN